MSNNEPSALAICLEHFIFLKLASGGVWHNWWKSQHSIFWLVMIWSFYFSYLLKIWNRPWNLRVLVFTWRWPRPELENASNLLHIEWIHESRNCADIFVRKSKMVLLWLTLHEITISLFVCLNTFILQMAIRFSYRQTSTSWGGIFAGIPSFTCHSSLNFLHCIKIFWPYSSSSFLSSQSSFQLR